MASIAEEAKSASPVAHHFVRERKTFGLGRVSFFLPLSFAPRPRPFLIPRGGSGHRERKRGLREAERGEGEREEERRSRRVVREGQETF